MYILYIYYAFFIRIIIIVLYYIYIIIYYHSYYSPINTSIYNQLNYIHRLSYQLSMYNSLYNITTRSVILNHKFNSIVVYVDSDGLYVCE